MQTLNQGPMLIEWDDSNLKEVDEAKKYYLQARKEGRKILDLDGEEVEKFRPALGGIRILKTEVNDTQISCRIYDKTGDRRLIWDMAEEEEIKEAARIFDEYIGKGWKPYLVNHRNQKGRRIYHFDPEAQEIYFDESRSVKEKIKDFVQSFKKEAAEIHMVPRTYPG